MTSYKLIKVKESDKDNKDGEKKEGEKKEGDTQNQSEKMQDLIVQSNLLSGGIENRFLTLFSQETQTTLNQLIQISHDKKLQSLLHPNATVDGKLQEDDKVVNAIIYKGQNPQVDRLIGYLQQFLERKIPLVAYARLSGEDGMRLSRAAFAVMIKFSEYFEEFNMLVDEMDMLWAELEIDPEREIKLKEALKSAPHYEQIAKRWENASKMRQWISEKKKNLSEKVKKEVEAEYTKKKAEDKKKREEQEQKERELKEKEQEQKDKAAAEEVKQAPAAEPEEVQIDTSTKP